MQHREGGILERLGLDENSLGPVLASARIPVPIRAGLAKVFAGLGYLRCIHVHLCIYMCMTAYDACIQY